MSPSSAETCSAPSPSDQQPRPKRIRLSVACNQYQLIPSNQCRKRKVRCDAGLPKCRNCRIRGDTCETTDLRNDGKRVEVRKWATRDGRGPDVVAYSDEYCGGVEDVTAGLRRGSGAGESGDHEGASLSPPTTPSVQNPPEAGAESGDRGGGGGVGGGGMVAGGGGSEPISWLQRAYRDSTVAGDQNHDSPELVVNTDDTPYRLKFLGGSSLQCLCRFVDLKLAHKGLEPVSSRFKHGMHHSEEFTLPLALRPPDLPASILQSCLDTFFDRLWPLFPIVDRTQLEAERNGLLVLQSSSTGGMQGAHLTSTDIPALASLYAIICIGTNEVTGCLSETSTSYLTAAYSLYGHLVAMPYLASVRALLLLAIALRGQMKEGQAWHVIGQAVRISYSLGLHKDMSRSQSHMQMGGTHNHQHHNHKQQQQVHRKIWWSCYALEKLMQLESGRPSIIKDEDGDPIPRVSDMAAVHVHGGTTDYSAAWISLARIMGQICDHIYSRKSHSSWELLDQTGRLDKALVEWETSLPTSLRPGLDQGHDAGEVSRHQHLSSFIYQHFYLAQITLLRASLLFPHESWTSEVRKHGSSLSSYPRLLNCSTICTQAARETATRLLYLADMEVRSIVLSPNPPLLAALVLALSILRQPGRRTARVELELLNSVTDYVADFYTRWGFDPAFIEACTALRDRVNTLFGRLSTTTTPSGSQIQLPPVGQNAIGVSPGTVGPMQGGHPSLASAASVNSAMSTMSTTLVDLDDMEPFRGFEFEEFWNTIGPDLMLDVTDVDFA